MRACRHVQQGQEGLTAVIADLLQDEEVSSNSKGGRRIEGGAQVDERSDLHPGTWVRGYWERGEWVGLYRVEKGRVKERRMGDDGGYWLLVGYWKRTRAGGLDCYWQDWRGPPLGCLQDYWHILTLWHCGGGGLLAQSSLVGSFRAPATIATTATAA